MLIFKTLEQKVHCIYGSINTWIIETAIFLENVFNKLSKFF